MARKTTVCNAKLRSGKCDGRLIAVSVVAEGLFVRCSRCWRSFILRINYADYKKIKDKEDGKV
jgi:hypothetical protein